MLNFLAAVSGNGAGGGGSFESIATATGTGSSGTITFSSIPSTYQHLQLRIMTRNTLATSSVGAIFLRPNGDTSTNYAEHRLFGSGSAVTASASTGNNYAGIQYSTIGDASTADVHGVAIIDIHDYASTTKNKTIRYFSGTDINGPGGFVNLGSGLWIDTTAISSLTLVCTSSGNFKTSSTFALYGIKGA